MHLSYQTEPDKRNTVEFGWWRYDVCWCDDRLFQMGDTRAACTGQWWTARQQENLLLSFCVREVTRWW